MKHRCLVTLLLMFIISIHVISQDKTYSITIHIVNLKNSKGTVALQLTNQDGVLIIGKTEKIHDNSSTIVIENLKTGVYTIRYFHDENNNEQLDCNWMKIPIEGYGFSNNVLVLFGSPSLKDREFKLNENLTLELNPKY